jgi:hypothetical protein
MNCRAKVESSNQREAERAEEEEAGRLAGNARLQEALGKHQTVKHKYWEGRGGGSLNALKLE